jgi:hypothetical protein
MDKKRTYVLELTTREVATLLCALMDYEKGVTAIPEATAFMDEWKRRQRKNVETINEQLR